MTPAPSELFVLMESTVMASGGVAPAGEPASWWSTLLSPSTQVLTGLVAALAASFSLWINLRKRRDERHELAGLIQATPIKDFDPGEVVGAYRAHNTTYLPLSIDAQIATALQAGEDVLICGRPGIGKSHCAAHHLAAYPKWILLKPTKQALGNLHKIKLPHRDYILLLDDLNEFVEASSGGDSVLDLVVHLRQQARRLRVIATVRNVLPEFETLLPGSKLLGRWRVFVLSDWTEDQGRDLAQLTGTDMARWDGTPLSVKQPSGEMKLKYHAAPEEQQVILRALKILRSHNLKPVSISLLCDFCQRHFRLDPLRVRHLVQQVGIGGFLKQQDDPVQAYDPYIEMIPTLWDTRAAYQALLASLIEGRRFDELVIVGSRWYAEKEFEEAETVFRGCIQQFPRHERGHYMLGLICYKSGRLKDAEAAFRQVVELQPRWAGAWYRLGVVLKKLGQTEEGAHAISVGYSVETAASPDTHWWRAEGLRRNAQFDAALRQIELSISRAEKPVAGMFFTQGWILQSMGRAAEAVAAQEKALNLDRDLPEAHLGMGFALRDLEKYADAERHFRRALELQPNDEAMARSYLASVLVQLKRSTEAEAELRRAVALDPETPEYHSHLGQVVLSLRRPAEAEREFARALELNPNYAEALVGLAATQRLAGKIDEAKRTNERAIKLDPELSAAFFGLGFCEMDQRRYDAAATFFRRAAELRPKFGAALFYLGVCLRALRKPELAAAELKRALKAGFRGDKTHFELARAYGQLRDTARVHQHLQSAVDAGMVIDVGQLSSDPSLRDVPLPENLRKSPRRNR